MEKLMHLKNTQLLMGRSLLPTRSGSCSYLLSRTK
ncbi:Protein CBG26289 [Caenorhabditis briggsae]|uniref:Protein CBG26289 n=1 Tax=Caenorhabditis briggsae TaxID=6238 RepID=B6ILY7_CAEBR|nr:Protein CBG26289 [Caenorhabditis briggsae]CAS00917.1 Protein CBG26289 [Caenorhabditis briggsae]